MYWAEAIGKPFHVKKVTVSHYKQPDSLTPEEVIALLGLCKSKKNRAIVATMAYLGLRPTECCELRYGDLRLRDGFVDVTDHGEGVKTVTSERSVSVVKEYLQFLNPWLEQRHRMSLELNHRPLDKNDYVFLDQWYQPYTKNSLYLLIQHITEGSSLEGKVYPYKLRKTYATVAAYSDVPVNVLSNEMGHKSTKTTFSYYIGVLKERNKQIMNERFTYLH